MNFKRRPCWFYKWYRPDLQAVIVIGDFDVNMMENKIKKFYHHYLKHNIRYKSVFGPRQPGTSRWHLDRSGCGAVVVSCINWIFLPSEDKR
ncbi:MAG: hypothetical protein ACLUDU_07860 [Butyricimonas faecihominis]